MTHHSASTHSYSGLCHSEQSQPTHRPVVVEVAKLVSKPLQVVGLEPR